MLEFSRDEASGRVTAQGSWNCPQSPQECPTSWLQPGRTGKPTLTMSWPSLKSRRPLLGSQARLLWVLSPRT